MTVSLSLELMSASRYQNKAVLKYISQKGGRKGEEEREGGVRGREGGRKGGGEREGEVRGREGGRKGGGEREGG